jgi:sterol 3beta-glucosyltransferase
LPETIFKIDQAPHSWLFPKTAAVVHHGGAGTTAAGLRAGKPSVIIPFFGDQPFWGKRVHDLGAGPKPIPQRKLNADRLAEALVEAVTNRGMMEAAAEMGRRIRRENGVADAVALIEKLALSSCSRAR